MGGGGIAYDAGVARALMREALARDTDIWIEAWQRDLLQPAPVLELVVVGSVRARQRQERQSSEARRHTMHARARARTLWSGQARASFRERERRRGARSRSRLSTRLASFGVAVVVLLACDYIYAHI